MDPFAFQCALAQEIAERLANGEEVVNCATTMRWFTFELDGEDLVVGDELQRAIEQIAGAPLIEFTPKGQPLIRALGFDAKDQPTVRARLAELPRPSRPLTLRDKE